MEDTISAMIETAIGGDVISNEGGGFMSVMAKSTPGIRQDIPAAFEAYTLLSYCLDRLPVHTASLNADAPVIDLSPAVLHDPGAGRLVALLPIAATQLPVVAYWLTDHMHSAQIKQMPGLLALPFSIETHAGTEHLLPEWYAAFYVHGEPGHCIPILALRSVLTDQRFGGDWVSVALERMTTFALPQVQARSANTDFTHNVCAL